MVKSQHIHPSPSSPGKLILASNTIGYAVDIPTRSLEALRTSDLLIFEEDRPARQALKAAGVHRDYVKYTEHKNLAVIDLLKNCLLEGKVACYMSDQGTPNLADPGRELLQLAYEMEAKIEVIPGPCSITAALSASPFSTDCFRYVGFLNRKSTERQKELEQFQKCKEAIVVLDTPYRLHQLIDDCVQILKEDRVALLALDIAGVNEKYIYGTLAKIKRELENIKMRCNFVLVLSAASVEKLKTKIKK